ncbi:class I SAM-dependent methyltransferase [Nakamurella sp.]|uniref:class I SAM-dependent methyltransferase n=1 Tax=Nakamurella sp. TaxID=1869182 RepID=UPI00378405A6
MVEQLRAAAGEPVEQALAALAAALARPGPGESARVRVLDVGGGSGTRAVPLALRGCEVTVIDSSANSLAILHRRAEDAGVGDRVVGIQADADRLDTVTGAGSVDLVLCHHLLEEVDDPEVVLAGVVRAVRPGGAVSVLAVGRIGAVLSQALVGRFEQARHVLDGADGRTGEADPLRRRLDVDQLRTLLQTAGLTVESVTGVGVLTGLLSGAARQAAPGGEADLADLEAAAAVHPELLRIASDLHVVARRPGAEGPAVG